MKYYAVIDTNVLVSAVIKPSSNPGMIVRLALEGVIIPLINDVILAEYRNVLSRPKFNFQHNIINDLIQAISNNAIKIQEKHIDIVYQMKKIEYFMRLPWNQIRQENQDSLQGISNIFRISHS